VSEPLRWSEDPNAPDGAEIFRRLAPPPMLPPELRRSPTFARPRGRSPALRIAIGVIAAGAIGIGVLVTAELEWEPRSEIVPEREREPRPVSFGPLAARDVEGPEVAQEPSEPAIEPDEAPVEGARAPKLRRTHPARPAAGATGTLLINTIPWSVVYVDGRRVGTTPIVALELAPGSHRLVCESADGRRAERTIRIVAGERSRISLRLDAQP
jgi:hypothetical protein